MTRKYIGQYNHSKSNSPKLPTFFFWSSSSSFHWLIFFQRPKYKILIDLYWGQHWQSTIGNVTSLFFVFASIFHHCKRVNKVEIITGHSMAIPNKGWLPLPSSLVTQYGSFLWNIFQYSKLFNHMYYKNIVTRNVSFIAVQTYHNQLFLDFHPPNLNSNNLDSNQVHENHKNMSLFFHCHHKPKI